MALRWIAPSGLLVALVVGYVAWTGQAHTYEIWSRRPNRITYCDRTYARSQHQAISLEDVEASPIGGPEPLERVGRIPPVLGRQVIARDAVAVESWAGTLDLCTAHLWLEVGDEEYVGYGLLGGP